MVEKVYTITSDSGLHARPSTVLVSAVGPFKADVILEYRERQVNLKSIMGVLSLGVPKGAQVKVIVNGNDESEVIATIDEVVKNEGIAI